MKLTVKKMSVNCVDIERQVREIVRFVVERFTRYGF